MESMLLYDQNTFTFHLILPEQSEYFNTFGVVYMPQDSNPSATYSNKRKSLYLQNSKSTFFLI